MCETKAAKVTASRDRTSAAFAADTEDRLTVWWCVFQVSFGHLSDKEEPLSRSGLNRVRVCVYHVNNVAAKRKPDIVRGHLAAMAIDICQLQIDIVAGDANGAAYSYYKRQRNPSPRNSSANTHSRRLLPATLTNSSLVLATSANQKVAAFAATSLRRRGSWHAYRTHISSPTTPTKT
jgi:hypothetical protein